MWESAYTFCGNNPVSRIDPDGAFWWFLIPFLFESQPVSAPTNEVPYNKHVLQNAWKSYNEGLIGDFIPGGGAGAKVTVKVAIKQAEKRVANKVGNEFKKEIEKSVEANKIKYLRQKAVKQAWAAEKDLVEKTGQGSRKWTEKELKELKETGKVKGYEGHHINSVKEHVEDVGDPSNIKFVKKGKEHLNEHKGNYRNSTSGQKINRN